MGSQTTVPIRIWVLMIASGWGTSVAVEYCIMIFRVLVLFPPQLPHFEPTKSQSDLGFTPERLETQILSSSGSVLILFLQFLTLLTWAKDLPSLNLN